MNWPGNGEEGRDGSMGRENSMGKRPEARVSLIRSGSVHSGWGLKRDLGEEEERS